MDENTDPPIVGPWSAAGLEPLSGESAEIEAKIEREVRIVRYMAEEYAQIAGDLDQITEWLHEVAEHHNRPELEQLCQDAITDTSETSHADAANTRNPARS
jgi:hypothetical protein